MKIAYVDCSAGIAGDMFMAALIDAGLSAKKLEAALKKELGIAGWKLVVTQKQQGHARATHVDVVGGHIHFDSPDHMLRLITKSGFPDAIKRSAMAVLDNLIDAEAAVHRVNRHNVHFHELNSIDTIVDVVGACAGLEMMGIKELYASPIMMGSPAPATMQMLARHRVTVTNHPALHEAATPTGTALMLTLARQPESVPVMRVSATGRGAGSMETPGRPNIVKVIIGDYAGSVLEEDAQVVLETNIDDMDPRIFPYVIEKLLEAGARDAWLTQVLMKKGRPGMVLSAISDIEHENALMDIIFSETTTLGIRRIPCSRRVLKRRPLRGKKTAILPDGSSRTRTEFESSKTAARASKKPLLSCID